MEWGLLALLFLLGRGRKTPGPVPFPKTPSPEGRIDILEVTRIPTTTSTGRLNRYAVRQASLENRGQSGAKWENDLRATVPADKAKDVDTWVLGICRWIGIESGGDPRTKTKYGEVGLTQVMKSNAPNWTAAQLAQYNSIDTPRDVLAKLVWKHVAELDAGVTPTWTASQRLWRCYMLHGLPALYKSLASQSFLIPNGPDPGGHFDAAWEGYKMPTALARYATIAPAGTAKGLMLRIVAAADTVAGYRRDWDTPPGPKGVV